MRGKIRWFSGSSSEIDAEALRLRSAATSGFEILEPVSAKRAIAIADALVARQEYLLAIDLLTAANRKHRDVEIDRYLVGLRFEAFYSVRHPQVPLSWPYTVEDLFPETEGIPELRRDEVTVERLRSAILRHGALIVRGLVSPGDVSNVVGDIDRAFAAYDSREQGAATSTSWYVPFKKYLSPHMRRWVRQTGGILAIESPTAMFNVLEVFEKVGLRRLVADYFNERPALLARKWVLRRVSHHGTFGDWHQDGAFMGKNIRSLNVWLSLCRCGADSPGLDIVGSRLEDLVPTGTDGAVFDWSVGPGAVERVAHGKVVRPLFEPGDAIFFDHMNLHRTAITPAMTRERYAVETWFLAPSTYADLIGSGKPTRRTRDQRHLPIVY